MSHLNLFQEGLTQALSFEKMEDALQHFDKSVVSKFITKSDFSEEGMKKKESQAITELKTIFEICLQTILEESIVGEDLNSAERWKMFEKVLDFGIELAINA